MAFTNFSRLIPVSTSEMPAVAAVALDPTAWTSVATFYARNAKAVLLRFQITTNAGNLTGDDRVEWYLTYRDNSGVTASEIREPLRQIATANGALVVQAGSDSEDWDSGNANVFRYFTSHGGGGSGAEHAEVVPLVANETPVTIWMRGRGKSPNQAIAPTVTGLEYALSSDPADANVLYSQREPIVSFVNSYAASLAGGITYQGAIENVVNCGSITLNALSTAASAANGLLVTWSISDAGAALITDGFTLAAGQPFTKTIPRRAAFVKVDFTAGPGGADVTVQTLLNPHGAGAELASSQKGTTAAAGVTSEAIDANTQALDVNIAGAAGVVFTLSRSGTAAETSVVAAAADTALLAANANRTGFEVMNDSDRDMRIAFGGAASATSVTLVPAGASYYDTYRYTGTVRGFWLAGVTGNARIRELTP